jgi:hypothetical protein
MSSQNMLERLGLLNVVAPDLGEISSRRLRRYRVRCKSYDCSFGHPTGRVIQEDVQVQEIYRSCPLCKQNAFIDARELT